MLEALRPLGPAASRVLTALREDRSALPAVPALGEREYLLARELEHPLERRGSRSAVVSS